MSAADNGLEVVDLESDIAFLSRARHPRETSTQVEGLNRLAVAFVDRPETVLQELVDTAIDLCGADSAGISLEQQGEDESSYYRWVATAGEYAGFSNAILPRFPSACGLCLERGKPQIFRVSQRFFDLMGIEAAIVTDGILLPWRTEEVRGTIWIMAHSRHEAFDAEDSRLMQVLANFAAIGVRQQRQRKLLMEQAGAAAAGAMANELAHQINNPLQSLTNLVYLAAESQNDIDPRLLAQEMSEHLRRLSGLVAKLLALPGGGR
jgi:hypothetical protein